MPAALRRILDAASVEGETFTVEVVAAATGLDRGQVQAWLSGNLDTQHRLVRAEAVRRLPAGSVTQYRFRHILFQRFVYQALDPVERVRLHEAAGEALERLWTGTRDEAAVQMAHHFEKAGLAVKAIGYLAQAGARAVRLAANQEAIRHYRQALDLLTALPESTERDRTELQLQIGLAAPLVAEKGYAAPEAEQACARAWVLCRQLGDPPELFTALFWLASYYGGCAQHATTLSVLEQFDDVTKRVGDPAMFALAQWMRGWHGMFLGNFVAVRSQLEHMVAYYRAERDHALAFVYGQDPGVASRSSLAITLWALGYPEQARRRGEEALQLARELHDPYSLALALAQGGCQLSWQGDDTAVEHAAAECIEVSTAHYFGYWRGGRHFLAGVGPGGAG